MMPGATAATPTPPGPTSAASARVSATRPPFARNRRRPAPGLPRSLRGRLGLLRVQRVDGDDASFRGQTAGDGGTDPLSGPRHQGDAIGEPPQAGAATGGGHDLVGGHVPAP